MPLLDVLSAFTSLGTSEFLHQIVPAGLHVEGVFILPIVARLRPEVVGVCVPPMVTEVTDQGCYWSSTDLPRVFRLLEPLFCDFPSFLHVSLEVFRPVAIEPVIDLDLLHKGLIGRILVPWFACRTGCRGSPYVAGPFACPLLL